MPKNNEVDTLKNKIRELEKKIENIGELKNDELKLSEEKFRLLFEKSYDPILIIDDYNFVECNKATATLLGLKSVDEISNVHPSKLSPEFQPDGRASFEKAQEMMDITYSTGYHRFEWMHSDKNGKDIWMDVSLTRIPYKGKSMLFTVWRDISKHKEYEKSLLESEKKYSSLFEQAADGILVGIEGGIIVEANESMVKLSGYEKEELIGKNIRFLFELDELDKKPLRYDLVNKGDTVIRERNILRKDGKIIHIEMNTKILDDGRMQALLRDISKRKEAEIALKASEEKYKSIFHNSPFGILHYDTNAIITDCNAQFVEIIGSTREKIIGLNMNTDIKNPNMSKIIKESLVSGKGYFEDWYSSVTAKKKTYIRSLFTNITDNQNKVISGIGLVEDVTEKKKDQEKIKENQLFINRITEQSPDLIYIFDVKSNKNIFINKDLNELLGFKKDISTKDSLKILEKLIHPDDAKQFRNYNNLVDFWDKQYIRKFEYRLMDSKGNWRWFYGREKEFQREKNEIKSIIGVVSDITDRKNAEQDLKISEEKFKSLATLLPEVVFEINKQGIITFVNLKAYQIFGYTPEDLKKGLSILQFVATHEVERVKRKLNTVPEDFKSTGERYIAITKNGKEFPILVYFDVITEDNEIVGFRGIIVNIAALARAQESVKKSEEKFRLLFENSQDAIFISNEKGFIDCNIKTLEIFGYKSKIELLDQNPANLNPEYQSDGEKSEVKSKRILTSVLKGEIKTFEWLHKKHNGETFYSEVNIIPIIIDKKHYIQTIIRDITERKEIEQRIYDAIVETEEKERQRLASDIHDEIGPLLSSLKMYIQSLNNSDDKEKQDFLKSKLQTLIVESINNVREVSNALSPYLLTKYGLNTAVKSTLDTTQELIKINFTTNLNDDRFGIKYETAYYRIIKELVNNTIKHAKATKINIKLNFINKELVLNYEDNGIGLEEKTLVNSMLSGMGLHNILNRIKSINGRYKFYSNNEKGFGFELISVINYK